MYLHSVIEGLSSVQIVDDPFAGDGIAHLHQGRSLLRLEELDALHVAVETKQIEQLVAIHLLRVESVENDDAALARRHAVTLK